MNDGRPRSRWPAWRWHVDLTDARQMAGLRARIVLVLAVMALATEASAFTTDRAVYAATPIWVRASIVLCLAAIALVVALRRDRMTDAEFTGLLLFTVVFGVVGVMSAEGPGQTSTTAVSILPTVILAAVFSGSRRHLAVLVTGAVVALGVVAALGAHVPGARADASTGAFAVVAVAFVVRLLLEMAARAIQAARRGEITDPLTGLANRRGLERLGVRPWLDHAQDQLPVAVLVTDVDHFKRVNDTLGHAAGDDLLLRLAGLLSRAVRSHDVAVRLGGEEFLVLCSVRQGEADAVAERIRAMVEAELAPVTVSIGVFETVPAPQDPFPAILWSAVDIADRALYSAKESGRNRVVSIGG